MRMDEPQRRTMHYSTKQTGTWDGMGPDLEPVCGQSEFIAVTSTVEAVDCMKCQVQLAKPQTENQVGQDEPNDNTCPHCGVDVPAYFRSPADQAVWWAEHNDGVPEPKQPTTETLGRALADQRGEPESEKDWWDVAFYMQATLPGGEFEGEVVKVGVIYRIHAVGHAEAMNLGMAALPEMQLQPVPGGTFKVAVTPAGEVFDADE